MNAEEKSQTVNSVVFVGQGEELKLLLIKRKYPPFAGRWALPGGFVKPGETVEQACARELQQETLVHFDQNVYRAELSFRQKEGRDPRGNISNHSFVFHTDNESFFEQTQAGEGIAEILFFKLEDVPELAFDHGSILCEALARFWSLFPESDKVLSQVGLPYPFSEKGLSNEKQITFFGGSFNPWHQGHQACLDLCPSKNIVVIPDKSPWKESSEEASRDPWVVYKELCLKLKNSKFAVYPGFTAKEQSNPTVDWLPLINVKNKELLVGDDTFVNLLKWKSSKTLLSNLDKIYVVPRNQEETALSDAEKEIKNIKKDINVTRLKNHQFQSVSSTELRSKSDAS